MIKVQILTQCDHCHGQAYLPIGEGEDYHGQKYTRYAPCPECEGSGMCPKWVSLAEFARLLEQAKCPHEHTSFQGGFHFNGGDLWDDLVEKCDDCGANLDRLPAQADESESCLIEADF